MDHFKINTLLLHVLDSDTRFFLSGWLSNLFADLSNVFWPRLNEDILHIVYLLTIDDRSLAYIKTTFFRMNKKLLVQLLK